MVRALPAADRRKPSGPGWTVRDRAARLLGDLLRPPAWEYDTLRDFPGVNGPVGRGGPISGNGGGVVVADGTLYVQFGYWPFYPSDRGFVLLAFRVAP
ncbi:hypothetical protein RM844_07225 [Streptomyces sp. DSM 44915]|uniref:Uncharacterized protein n=1 Tax=Streptomyces chisholmiae TaxID=3075540 RepID=A0ABU2JM82_9ACTN|nr:hypothetical protein [Streptomyces sp. DSM 44915]MDT0266085.1 hypothetical protein [Streptomyces sp. DSM 44915]